MVREEAGQGENLLILKDDGLCAPGPQFLRLHTVLVVTALYDHTFVLVVVAILILRWMFKLSYNIPSFQSFTHFPPSKHIYIFPTRLLGLCPKF